MLAPRKFVCTLMTAGVLLAAVLVSINAVAQDDEQPEVPDIRWVPMAEPWGNGSDWFSPFLRAGWRQPDSMPRGAGGSFTYFFAPHFGMEGGLRH